MVNFSEHTNLLAGLVVLWITITIIYYVYNNVFSPVVRVMQVDVETKTATIKITHKMAHAVIHVSHKPEMIEFEGERFHWVIEHDKPGIVYSLNVEKQGRLKEVVVIDFTNQKVLQHAV